MSNLQLPNEMQQASQKQAMQMQQKAEFYSQVFMIYMNTVCNEAVYTDQALADIAMQSVRKDLFLDTLLGKWRRKSEVQNQRYH